MTRRRVASALVVALLGALPVGCGGGRDDARPSATYTADSATSDRAPAGAATAGGGAPGDAGAPAIGGARPACAYSGRWDPCTITERLDRSGLAPQPATDSAPHPALGAPTASWMLGSARLVVFVYPDKRAREAAQKKLDAGQYLTPDEEVGMNALPTLITSENLLALFDSRNEHQRERVADAITAGPPQAGR